MDLKHYELFSEICKNSIYGVFQSKTLSEKKKLFQENKCFDKKYWYDVETTVPYLLCPVEVIERYTGQPYDFTEHIMPLVDAGLIYVRGWTNCFPHSPELAEFSFKKHALVGDYAKKQNYLQFYMGNVDPNSLKTLEPWL